MSEITVQALQARVDDWHKKRLEVDKADEELTALRHDLDAISSDLIRIMEELGIEKFEGTLGKIRLHTDEYVTLPEDDIKRFEFIEYLKGLGVWDNFATIHHSKLQSWHKSMREEHGEFFMCPGLELPKVRKSIRKSR